MSGYDASEWKPGDVAMAQCSDSRWRPAFYAKAPNGSGIWRFADGMMRSEEITYARRLVVIDPEDAEQVERLSAAYEGTHIDIEPAEAVREALREFANPTPRIEEPQGLGAVVEDETGERWIRAARIAHGWHRPMGTWAAWVDIKAVRVLSEGVTP